MREKLQALQQIAQSLEPTRDERERLRAHVVHYTEKFLDDIADFDKSLTYQKHTNGKELLDYPITDEPIGIEKAISLIDQHVDKEGLNPASGGLLGYIPGGGIYSSSLGDYWAAITNRFAGVFFANPGAVYMENHLLDWMKTTMGYPQTALGNMTSGGSIANLTAILTARDTLKLKAATIPQHVIYLSQQVHHSIDKAIHIAGLSECVIRHIELDDQYRMDVDHLKEAITGDLAVGLTPFLVVASAGTTNTGAIDPLPELAKLTKKHKMWFHVDAAYGGFFMLTEEGREKLAGIELSDSLVIDPHKGLFVPYGLGVVLIKDGANLKNTFAFHADYMQDMVQPQDEVSPAEVSPELTKHFRALRLWLPLMIHGVKPFKACLEEKLLLTKYAYNRIKNISGFEVGPEPELSLFTFRYTGQEKEDDNEFNAKLVQAIHDDGRIFVSSTTLGGKFTLRFAILSFRTHLDTIDLAINILEEKVRYLQK